MKYELEDFHRNTDEKELLEDLVNAYRRLKDKGVPLTYRSYAEIGKYSSSTFAARFGSWNKALIKAKIVINEEKDISDKDLFLNLEQVWTYLGRQPRTRDLIKPSSKYSYTIYLTRFGGWRKALEAFVEYINEEENTLTSYDEPRAPKDSTEIIQRRKTNRNISERMRFRILLKDGFTCQTCGASPMKTRGVELHVDHILPWSKGGETVEENLQTKCKQCNLGKGNAFNQ